MLAKRPLTPPDIIALGYALRLSATNIKYQEPPDSPSAEGVLIRTGSRRSQRYSLSAGRGRAGVAEMSEYFRVRLLQLESERPAAVRIQGLAIGIDVGDEDYADTIHDKCRRNGLLVSTEGSTVLLLPSLAIDARTAARGLDILARSI